MRRILPLLLALVLGMLSALTVACGDDEDDRRLLSQSRADTIKEELDTIAERVERGECTDLQPAFVRLGRAVDGLPSETDRGLRRRLAEGVENLREVAPIDCRRNRPETTTTETLPETTAPPPETTPPQTTTTPPPTTTTPPETTPTQPEPEPEPEPPVDPGGSGGSQAPSGFVPPGQARKGDTG